MLVLKEARLVYLANPKTAGRSLRLALEPFAIRMALGELGRHISAQRYRQKLQPLIAAELGFDPETFAVMREPRSHMESWFRYLQRAATEGGSRSTQTSSFADFVTARLAEVQPAFARIGRQDGFLGYHQGRPQITHVFDYARLDLLVGFLSAKLGQDLGLPWVNASPPIAPEALVLPAALEARYRAAHAAEFELYAKVEEAGVLVSR